MTGGKQTVYSVSGTQTWTYHVQLYGYTYLNNTQCWIFFAEYFNYTK